MKILQVIPYFHPALQYGGPIPVVMGLSRALAARGHHVTVATTTADGSAELDVPVNTSIKKDNFEIIYFRRLRWERLFTAIRYVGQSVGFFYSPQLRDYLNRIVQDFDIVHVHDMFCYPAVKAGQIARRNGVPYFVHTHCLLDPARFVRRRFKKTMFMNLLGGKLLNQARGIIALTETEREHLREYEFTAEIGVIPNGTDINGCQNGSESQIRNLRGLENKQVILFLGRLHLVKGVDLLIDAYARIASKHPDSILLIAGPDEVGLEKELVQQVERLKLSRQVKFIGMVQGEVKEDLLRRCDLFALTSHSEGFSMAILEALSFGKPVVITKMCHFDDVGTHCAGFINPAKKEPIARSLDTLLEDPNLRQQMGENAVKLIEDNYTWDIVAEKTERFYSQALQNSHTCDLSRQEAANLAWH